jgi:hypothetical protein
VPVVTGSVMSALTPTAGDLVVPGKRRSGPEAAIKPLAMLWLRERSMWSLCCIAKDEARSNVALALSLNPSGAVPSAFRYLTKPRILCSSFGNSGSFSKSMWFLLFSMTKRAPGMLAAKYRPSESGATESSSL